MRAPPEPTSSDDIVDVLELVSVSFSAGGQPGAKAPVALDLHTNGMIRQMLSQVIRTGSYRPSGAVEELLSRPGLGLSRRPFDGGAKQPVQHQVPGGSLVRSPGNTSRTQARSGRPRLR